MQLQNGRSLITNRGFIQHQGDSRVEPRVIIGIPNVGGFHRPAVSLLRRVVKFSANDRSLVHGSSNVAVICARASDLPLLLALEAVDLVVTGRDYLVEAEVEAEEICDLGIHRGIVGVLGKEESADWRSWERVTVATSLYPRLAASYFAGASARSVIIYKVSGATELYARIGAVDVIVDSYVSGATAAANGLYVLEVILQTSGGIFARPGWRSSKKDIGAIVRALLPR